MVTLKEGDKAPSFKATDQNGNSIDSGSLKGSHYLLYFYPKDDTPTCTIEACNLRDHFNSLKQAGITVIGISPDDVDSHSKFATKYDLPFSILPDPNHTIINKYGVWGEKQMYGRKYIGLNRTSFLIDENGIIQKIFLKPQSARHAEEVLNALSSIG